MMYEKSFVFCTLRKSFLAHVLLQPQRRCSLAGWGRAAEWGRVCTPAMYGCWWVFLAPLFFLFVQCIFFSSCLQDTVTHISIQARDSARGVWGARVHGQRWPNFNRLMTDAASLSSYFKIYELSSALELLQWGSQGFLSVVEAIPEPSSGVKGAWVFLRKLVVVGEAVHVKS